MKKRLFFATVLLLLCLTFVTVSADAKMPRLVDHANLLTEEEAVLITEKLDEISTRQNYDVVIVTVDSVGSKSMGLYAADIYEEYGYGFGDDISGTILLISIEDREWYVAGTGEGEDVLPDPDAISDEFVGYLSDGEYYQAFDAFADAVDSEITDHRTFPIFDNLVIAVVIALIAAFVITASMKAKLKSVKLQNNAREYVRAGSFKVAHSRDLYLYSTVTRVPRPKNNSNGGGFKSSSGRSFSGGGGRF